MRVEIVTEIAELEAIAGPWKELWRRHEDRDIFSAPEWWRAAWDAYGQRRKLVAPVVYDANEIVGILPLAVESGKLIFAGSPRSDYNDIVCDPDGAPEIARCAMKALASLPVAWRVGELENVPGTSILMSLREDIRDIVGGYCRFSFSSDCPRVCLDSPEVAAGILRKKSLRRHFNKLSRMGDLQFRHLEDRAEIRSHLPTFFDQHVARRMIVGDRSVFQDQAARRLYERLIEELDPSGPLRFGVVELNRRPIAYHLGFETAGRFIWYKPTFDVDCLDYSPGEVLLKFLFEYAEARDVSVFDFTVGTESFKDRFANARKQNFTLYICPGGSRGLRSSLRIRAKESLKTHPRLFSAIKTGASRIGAANTSVKNKLNKHGLVGCATKIAAQLFRTLIYQHDEVLIFRAPRGVDVNGTDRPGHFTVREGTLSELTSLPIEYPNDFPPETVVKAVGRLKKGDRVHLAWLDGQCVHVAWTGLRDGIKAESDVGPGCEVKFEKPSLVIYSCRTPSPAQGQGFYTHVLKQLIADGHKSGWDVWVTCRSENTASKLGIQKAGFEFVHRATRRRCLRLFENKTVQPASSITNGVAEATDPGSQPLAKQV